MQYNWYSPNISSEVCGFQIRAIIDTKTLFPIFIKDQLNYRSFNVVMWNLFFYTLL